ncbi:MAG: TfoX/Sxy family protein [Clostridia bacterium]|nr:TfoX/Sxy family protein [Clostridia bacterium]
MTDLTTLTNIGKEMASKLKSVEINCVEKLIELGSKEAFFRLKTKYPQVCLVHLYTLEGAIENVEFNSLSEETKADLKAFSDSLK